MADERRFWYLMSAVLGLSAALKGLQLPGFWPLTEAQLGYSQGFVKRGLAGWLYNLADWHEQRPLFIVFFAQLLLLMVLLAVWARRTRLAAACGSPMILAVCAGSYAVTYLFHIVGYTDLVGCCFTVALLLIKDVRVRFAAALPVVCLGLMLHEDFLVLFLPVLVVSFFLDSAHSLGRPPLGWRLGAVLAAAGILVAAVIVLQPPLSAERIDALADVGWQKGDFPLREDFFQIFQTSLPDTLSSMYHFGWRRYRFWIDQAVGVCVFLPVLLLLLHLSRRILRTAAAAKSQVWLLYLAVLSPLTLHLIALDAMRWDTWVVVDAFLALGLIVRRHASVRLTLTPAERHAGILVLALGMAAGWGLFGTVQINPYPFFPKALLGHADRQDHHLPGF